MLTLDTHQLTFQLRRPCRRTREDDCRFLRTRCSSFPALLTFRAVGCRVVSKVGIMEVDSEHMRMRLMPSPVQCLNAIKVRVLRGRCYTTVVL